MMYQCKFIHCNKYTALKGAYIDSGGGCAHVGSQNIWENICTFLSILLEPKTALEK